MATQVPSPNSSANSSERLIFALDISSPDEALAWVRRLSPVVKFYKVGWELFLAGGWDVVHRVRDLGGNLFLDLKLLDIPQTVARALRIIETHVDRPMLLTLHGFNAAIDPALKASLDPRLKLLAVTVLTSQSQADLRAMGVGLSVQDYALRIAERARDNGFDGVIASGQEAAALRQRLGPDFLIVTPGIRPAGPAVRQDDQARVTTPAAAIRSGADYLVVGRPIRDAADPLAVAQAIQAEIAAAL
jgi:orotidine-5'-phosphate decarboxylase